MSTTKTRRIWIALVAAIAALALGFSLSGCAGESDEELITKAIDEEMSIIVEPDDETHFNAGRRSNFGRWQHL